MGYRFYAYRYQGIDALDADAIRMEILNLNSEHDRPSP